jgi:hypothetical protein
MAFFATAATAAAAASSAVAKSSAANFTLSAELAKSGRDDEDKLKRLRRVPKPTFQTDDEKRQVRVKSSVTLRKDKRSALFEKKRRRGPTTQAPTPTPTPPSVAAMSMAIVPAPAAGVALPTHIDSTNAAAVRLQLEKWCKAVWTVNTPAVQLEALELLQVRSLLCTHTRSYCTHAAGIECSEPQLCAECNVFSHVYGAHARFAPLRFCTHLVLIQTPSSCYSA